MRLQDFVESGPWRRVRAVHGLAHFSGDYASATTGGHVVYESRLEELMNTVKNDAAAEQARQEFQAAIAAGLLTTRPAVRRRSA